MRGLALVVGGLAIIATAPDVRAQPKPALPAVVGATEVVRFAAPSGFVDDVVASDADRLAYVIADGSAKTDLHLVTLATKADAVVDLSAVTLHPVGLHLAGPRALVIGQNDDGSHSVALVELTDKGKGKPAGSVVWKAGPARHVTVVTRDGKPRVAMHRATEGGVGTRHEVELLALENGVRLAPPRTFEVDATGTHRPLDLKVNHWSDGWTRAHGIKGGTWDPKENMRGADVEATYDLVLGKIAETKKIDDLFDQRKRFQVLVDAGNRVDFVRIAPDGATAQVWRGGRPRPLELDQPIAQYDPKTQQSIVLADGSAWLAIKVDPVNPEAVARKKADPEYLDIYRVPADGKAVRKARILAAGTRHRFGVVGERFWLIERNQGFDRGGKSLVLYQVP
ncbi:MAG: hypothetical protein KIT31_29880 [Deltaproteobacteria bacterium]|nr:hypothetical protein [Deltaproteobacteria bacterium]